MAECVALVVAAGRGIRAGGGMPKQYRLLAGRPVLAHSLAVFAAHRGIDTIRVVIHPDDRALYDDAAAGFHLPEPAHGGATRQDSVRLGLESLAPLPPRRVLIHDAARPFVDPGTTGRAIEAPAGPSLEREKIAAAVAAGRYRLVILEVSRKDKDFPDWLTRSGLHEIRRFAGDSGEAVVVAEPVKAGASGASGETRSALSKGRA